MLPLKESAGWLCHEFRAIFVSPRREVYYLPLFSSSSSSPHYEHVSAILFRSPEEDERDNAQKEPLLLFIGLPPNSLVSERWGEKEGEENLFCSYRFLAKNIIPV